MADNANPILAAIGMGTGLLQAGISGLGMGKAKKDVDTAVGGISTYTADPEVMKMLRLRQARAGIGLSAMAKQLAQQGIGTSAATATRAASMLGKGAALSSIGAIQKQASKQFQDLGLQEEAAQERNRLAYERAIAAASSERARQFQSEQEKQQLKANIALEKLAARRASVSQGLSGLTGAASTALYGGGFGSKKPKYSGGINTEYDTIAS